MMIEVPYKKIYIPVGKVTLKRNGKLNLKDFPFGSRKIVLDNKLTFICTVLAISDCDTYMFYMLVISDTEAKTPKFYILRLNKDTILNNRVEYVIKNTPQDASFIFIKEMESFSGERINYAEIFERFKGASGQVLHS